MSKKRLVLYIIAVVVIIAGASVGAAVLLSGGEDKPELSEFDAVLEQADAYFEDEEYEKAIEKYEKAIKLDPSKSKPYMDIADAYIALGDYEKAFEVLQLGLDETESERIMAKLSDLLYDNEPEWEEDSAPGIDQPTVTLPQATEPVYTEPIYTEPEYTFDELDKDVLPDVVLENETVKWFAYHDLNATYGQEASYGLELFEQEYGGRIEWVPTTWDNRYTDLATCIVSGQSPDIFPADTMDAIPMGAIKNMFQPVDEYIDFSADYWSDMTAVNDALMFGGKHYIAATSAEPASICVYNRNVIEENGFEDPAELFAQGRWNWDTFEEMCLAFTDPAENKYALDGRAAERAIFNSSGVPLITVEGSTVVLNSNNSAVERIATLMNEMQKSKALYPRLELNGGSVRGGIDGTGMNEGLLLFCPIGMWSIEGANTAYLGNMAGGDIMFVPMPKNPDDEDYPICTNVSGYLLVNGAPNPEGAAIFINCEMAANADYDVQARYVQRLMNDCGWTQEMVDMKYTLIEMCMENPVIDFSTGLTNRIEDISDRMIRELMTPGEMTWDEIKVSYGTSLQALIDETNEMIQQGY